MLLYLLEVLDVLEVLKMPVMRCVLLCLMGGIGDLEVPEVMRCTLLSMLEIVEGGAVCAGGTGGDALCATLYAGGSGG